MVAVFLVTFILLLALCSLIGRMQGMGWFFIIIIPAIAAWQYETNVLARGLGQQKPIAVSARFALAPH